MDEHQKFKTYTTKHLNRIDNSTNKSKMMMYTRFFLIYLLINKKFWKDDVEFIKNIRKRLKKTINNKDVISLFENSDNENNVLNYIYDECCYKTTKNTLCKNKVKYGNISCWVHKKQNRRRKMNSLKEKDPKYEGMLMMVNQSRYELGKPPIRYKN